MYPDLFGVGMLPTCSRNAEIGLAVHARHFRGCVERVFAGQTRGAHIGQVVLRAANDTAEHAHLTLNLDHARAQARSRELIRGRTARHVGYARARNRAEAIGRHRLQLHAGIPHGTRHRGIAYLPQALCRNATAGAAAGTAAAAAAAAHAISASTAHSA